MQIQIKESEIIAAAQEGMDAFVDLFVRHIQEAAGGELNAEALAALTPSQITLWGYAILHEEVMDGGFVQLIHNGYGPFFFRNPFAKALRLWGLHDLSKLLYAVRALYDAAPDALTADCSDDEFMALFEQHPEYDEHDDAFVENEEEWTAAIAHYIDEHLDEFCEVVKEPSA